MVDVESPGVAYVLLYRTPTKWRITIGEIPEALACGALPRTTPDAPFEEAAAEFEALLREQYGLATPIAWEQDRPDWWGADLAGTRPE